LDLSAGFHVQLGFGHGAASGGALNSFGLFPGFMQSAMSGALRWCIVISIAALGIETSQAVLAMVGHVMTLVRLGRSGGCAAVVST
jgi:uncharacterized membrane protein YadS